MLHYFPENNINGAHRTRDYVIAAFTFICVAISLNVDASGSLENQNFMGIIAWIFLIGLLVGENKDVRTQVVIAVVFATVGEHFASIYMGGYIYRFDNVPAYVPWTWHGLSNGNRACPIWIFLEICKKYFCIRSVSLWYMVSLGD